MKPLVTDASDKKQIKSAEQKEQLIIDRLKADYAKVLSMPEGRRILWHYLEHTYFTQTTWSPQHSLFSLNEGKRAVGLMIYEEICACDRELFFQMIRENMENDNG